MNPTSRFFIGAAILWFVPYALQLAPLKLPHIFQVILWLIITYGAIFWFLSGLEAFQKFRNSLRLSSIRVNMGVIIAGAITGAILSLLFWHLLPEEETTLVSSSQDDTLESTNDSKAQNTESSEQTPEQNVNENQKVKIADLKRAKECLADFSSAWSSSDVYIIVAPVSDQGGISIGHPYVRTKDTPEDFDRSQLAGGIFVHLMDAGRIRVEDEYYSALLWNGGIPGGGITSGENWEEGNKWIELAKKSGAELLHGEYGVQVVGGSPESTWALVVALALWKSEWRKQAPGTEHFMFPAYPSSVETWKRLIRGLE